MEVKYCYSSNFIEGVNIVDFVMSCTFNDIVNFRNRVVEPKDSYIVDTSVVFLIVTYIIYDFGFSSFDEDS